MLLFPYELNVVQAIVEMLGTTSTLSLTLRFPTLLHIHFYLLC